MQHTFFVHFFAVVLHDYNAKLPETFLWRKCRTCSLSIFFSLPLIFSLHWWPLAFLILLPPLQNFMLFFQPKKCLLCFLSLALDLCRPFFRWVSLACRLLSLFLLFSLTLYSKFVDVTINLTDTETISAFRFRLYWLFSRVCFTRRGRLSDFPPK